MANRSKSFTPKKSKRIGKMKARKYFNVGIWFIVSDNTNRN